MRSIFGGMVLAVALLAGSARAQDYETGKALFLSGDYAAALVILQPLAQAGDPKAENALGIAHQYGHGVAVDAALALGWYEKAALQDSAPAIHNLGVLYEAGMPGLAADEARARGQYERSVALDYLPSFAGLARMQLFGIGGPADLPAGIALYERGMAADDAPSIDGLAFAYSEGLGVAQDEAMARTLYARAAGLGYARSLNNLAALMEFGRGGPVDLDGALDRYRQAMAAGNVLAALNIAWLMWENPDQFPDAVEAMAHCLWAFARAPADQAADWGASCNAHADLLSPEDLARAQGRAAAL